MAKNTREIRRRIKSITNTKKITKAMELVSASKMRKAVNQVFLTRSYAQVAWETILTLAKKVDVNLNPLLRQTESVKNVAVIVIASNRGLCGGFNTNIVNKTISEIRKVEGRAENIDIITMGKKCYTGLSRLGHKMKADFEKKDITTSITDIYSISRLILDAFMNQEYDKVLIAYTDYHSALRQVPRVVQLLPLSTEEVDEELGEAEDYKKHERKDELAAARDQSVEYILEPDPKMLLDQILPKIIEIKLYQAVLESDASEHSARMMAMRNATDAAQDMIDSLTFVYNQARQASITQEISEISAGKASLER
jgi:F-type H+-transporting ATPase subunit gamma